MAGDLPGGRLPSGLILGKFLPPHRGHQYLVEFAQAYVERLTVLVCSLASEPIPGELRLAWMRELFPDVDLQHVTDENPSFPEEHPQFWEIWVETIRQACHGTIPEILFTSESYGAELASRLGIRHVPVDAARELVPVSGTAIRERPLAHWEYLPPPVRPYFLRRVAIIGPESTGKTTLAQSLARQYGTLWVSEYARSFVDYEARMPVAAEVDTIARGQLAAEAALARHANRVLFSDTEQLTTIIYGEVYYGGAPEWLHQVFSTRPFDLYLVCHPDVPWVADPQRDLPHYRDEFLARCIQELETRGRRWVPVRGDWQARHHSATAAVDAMLAEG